MQTKVMERLKQAKPVFYANPHYDPKKVQKHSDAKVEDAARRLERFAPFLSLAFPETKSYDGKIESPLLEVPYLAARLREIRHFSGNLWLKDDARLPVSGSIKARGGIYEVLSVAEELALAHDKITTDSDYSIFRENSLRAFFSDYEISVGSTGNLGLSIGIMGRALGFRVTVHMSADARRWKKDKLRSIGATVIEYESDYEEAVRQGREEAARSPQTHFVDDENSETLFLGYAVAGQRLKEQLDKMKLTIDADHPLFVYLPCGVGGGPGGVAYGIQNAIGPHAHCVFVEPVQAPCMLLSILTQTHGEISVKDIGLHGKTEADGLAVGRASTMVSQMMTPRLDALFTVDDASLYNNLRQLYQTEGIFIEPSAASTFAGPAHIEEWGHYTKEKLAGAHHILWATGGGMVPEEVRNEYLRR